VHPGKLLGGRFRIERRVAAGGMGEVFRALDSETGAPVAVKRVQSDLARFHREIEVLAAIDHPGIVRYVAHGPDYLVMEWLEGETLAARLEERGLSLGETLAAVGSAAAALGEAHRRGVVHRDVKPTNLLFTSGATVKVIDFGIALRDDQHGALTETGTELGTPGYMAPEQLRGDDVTARADVFALGCVLYECLTGRPAFDAPHFLGARGKILFVHPPPPASPLPALDGLVLRMLDKDPARRPADGTEVAAALAKLPATGGEDRALVTRSHRPTRRVPVPRAGAPVTCAVAVLEADDPTVTRARDLGGVCQRFPDGSLIAIFGPSVELRATVLTAAELATFARARSVVALASDRGDGDLLAEVGKLLAAAALAEAVGAPPRGARLDAAAATLLGGARETVDVDGALYLL
jgi:eukaryotic-like serine/threonine-protein kinase